MLEGCAGHPWAIIRHLELLPSAYRPLLRLQKHLSHLGISDLALPPEGSNNDPTKYLPIPADRGNLDEALTNPFVFSRNQLQLIHLMESLPPHSASVDSHYHLESLVTSIVPSKPIESIKYIGNSFHLMGWCTAKTGKCDISARQLRALESIMFHHPGIPVTIYYNQDEMIPRKLQTLQKLDLPIKLSSYKLIQQELENIAEYKDFSSLLHKASIVDQPFLWKLLGLLIFGGTIIDLGVICLRSLDAIPDKTIGFLSPSGRMSLFLKFQKPHNAWLLQTLREIVLAAESPNLVFFDFVIEKAKFVSQKSVNILTGLFMEYSFSSIQDCFVTEKEFSMIGEHYLLDLVEDATGAMVFSYGSYCQRILRASCIICDEGVDKAIMQGTQRLSNIVVNLPQKQAGNLIHLVWTTKANTFLPWRKRVLETIFFHNPRAQVRYYSNELAQEQFAHINAKGFHIEVVPLSCHELFLHTPLEQWYLKVATWKEGPFFFSHVTDGLRLALLWKYGGLYMDSDFVVLRDLSSLPSMVAGQGAPKFDINGAFMKMSAGHPFLALAMEGFVARYYHECVKGKWQMCYSKNWNIVGPDLITSSVSSYQRMSSRLVVNVTVLESTSWSYLNSLEALFPTFFLFPWQVIYPIPWSDAENPLYALPFKISNVEIDRLESKFGSIAVHLWSNRNRFRGIPPFSFGDLLLQKHSLGVDQRPKDPPQWISELNQKVSVIVFSRKTEPSSALLQTISSLQKFQIGTDFFIALQNHFYHLSNVTAGSTLHLNSAPSHQFVDFTGNLLARLSEIVRFCSTLEHIGFPQKQYIAIIVEGMTVDKDTSFHWALDILENDQQVAVIGGVPEQVNIPEDQFLGLIKISECQKKKCYCKQKLYNSGLQRADIIQYPLFIARSSVLLTLKLERPKLKMEDLFLQIAQNQKGIYIMPELLGKFVPEMKVETFLDEVFKSSEIVFRKCSSKEEHTFVVSIEPS